MGPADVASSRTEWLGAHVWWWASPWPYGPRGGTVRAEKLSYNNYNKIITRIVTPRKKKNTHSIAILIRDNKTVISLFYASVSQEYMGGRWRLFCLDKNWGRWGPTDVAGNHICDGWIGDGRTGLMDGWGHFKGGDRETHKEGRERERERENKRTSLLFSLILLGSSYMK